MKRQYISSHEICRNLTNLIWGKNITLLVIDSVQNNHYEERKLHYNITVHKIWFLIHIIMKHLISHSFSCFRRFIAKYLDLFCSSFNTLSAFLFGHYYLKRCIFLPKMWFCWWTRNKVVHYKRETLTLPARHNYFNSITNAIELYEIVG